MRRLGLAGVLASAVLAAACGGDAPMFAPALATLDDMRGPWRPVPLVLDQPMRNRVADTCRQDMQRKPTSLVGVIDARGSSVAVVRMVGDSAGACNALEITADAGVTGAGGGWSAEREQLALLPGDAILDVEVSQVGGGELKAEGVSVMGRAGQGIASVVVETPGQPPILASLENGWFAAWWPIALPMGAWDGPDLPEVPYIVRGFDAAGTQIAEVSN